MLSNGAVLGSNGKFLRQGENNKYTEKENYYNIEVSNSNHVYKVNKEDFHWMSNHTWFSDSNLLYPYLISKIYSNGKREKMIYHVETMKKEIENFKKNNIGYNKRVIVDHIGGDVKNNLKSNLRVRTQSENNMNKITQTNNTSGFVGITWHINEKMWTAQINIHNEAIRLGSFYYLRNALKIRMDAEKEHFGEHSLYNRDEDYRCKVDKILGLPHIDEPVFIISSKASPVNIRGINYISQNAKNKFRVKIEGFSSKSFMTSDEAIEYHRELMNEKHNGRPLIKAEDKIDKEI